MFNFLKNFQTVFESGRTILHSPQLSVSVTSILSLENRKMQVSDFPVLNHMALEGSQEQLNNRSRLEYFGLGGNNA